MHAETAVCHILTGKAISQPIPGQILIEAVLYAIILSYVTFTLCSWQSQQPET